MLVLFNFHSFLTVVLLEIYTCTYLKMQFPAILEQRTGFCGFFWKAARIGGSPFLLGLLLSGKGKGTAIMMKLNSSHGVLGQVISHKNKDVDASSFLQSLAWLGAALAISN
ncbi:hypothetical protein REPUB_Repub04eG0198600 [Reevesia pubescens]